MAYLFLITVLFILLHAFGRWLQPRIADGHALFCGSATKNAGGGLVAIELGLAMASALLIEGPVAARWRGSEPFFNPNAVRSVLALMTAAAIGHLYLLSVYTCLTGQGLTVRNGFFTVPKTYRLSDVTQIVPYCVRRKYGARVESVTLRMTDGQSLFLDDLWLRARSGEISALAGAWPETPVDWSRSPLDCSTTGLPSPLTAVRIMEDGKVH
ncbi:MAG: hypothetical protein PW843_18210 [Azospirillaceae bacterium]|nr:hypothetical protein [Azospirillaceae bacterium]